MKIKITFVSHVRCQSGVYFVVGHSCESIKSYYDLFVFPCDIFRCRFTADASSEFGGGDRDVDCGNPLDTLDSCEAKIKIKIEDKGCARRIRTRKMDIRIREFVSSRCLCVLREPLFWFWSFRKRISNQKRNKFQIDPFYFDFICLPGSTKSPIALRTRWWGTRTCLSPSSMNGSTK